jgi:uncharacterized membrane protein YbhN (UPF0104 family)
LKTADAAVPTNDSGAVPAGDYRPTLRQGWRRWARRAFIAALAGFAAWAIVGNWAEISSALRQLSAWAVVAAFVPALLAMGVSLFVWRTLMADMGHRLPVAAAARIFYLSQLGKYVPGSVWSILTQIELSREHKIPKRTNVAVGVLVIAIAVTSGLMVAALLLPFGAGATLRQYWWILPIIPVLLGGLHPRVIGSGLNLVLRLARREPLPRTPSWAGLGRVVGLQILVWLCLGLQAWVLLIGMGASAEPALPVAIGGYALAYSLGQMAIGFPAGAVVRDAALALALSAVVPGATALVVALLARVILTVVDLVLAGGQYLALRRSNRTRAFLLI